MYFRDAADRVPTNYDKDKSGNIVPWNGVQAMADSGTPIFKTGPRAPLLDGGRRRTGSAALLRVARIRERLRHRAEQPAARVQRAREPQHADRHDDRRIDEPQLHRHVDAPGRGRRARPRCSAPWRDIRCSSRAASMGFYPGFPAAVPQTLYDNATGLNRFTGSTTVNNQLARWFTQRGVLGLDYTDQDDRAIEHFAPPQLAAILSPAAAGGRIGQTLRRTTLITADYSGTAKADLSPRSSRRRRSAGSSTTRKPTRASSAARASRRRASRRYPPSRRRWPRHKRRRSTRRSVDTRRSNSRGATGCSSSARCAWTTTARSARTSSG